MPTRRDRQAVRTYPDPVIFLLLFFIVIFLATVCVLLYLLLFARTRPAPTPALPDVQFIPPPTAAPAQVHPAYFPFIQGGATLTPTPSPVWQVLKVEDLGYQQGNERFDLATFEQNGTMAVLQGYCIDRGMAVPAPGTLYTLGPDNIFTPVTQPPAQPLQRFAVVPSQ